MNIEDAKTFLISHGVLPNLDEKGRQEFHWAISEGKLESVKAWLVVGMTVNTKHEDSYPIIRAAEGDNAEMVAFLVDEGADLNARDNDGDTALHTAVNWTAEDALEMLIEKKSPLDTSNDIGRTPLISALENNTEYVQLLLDAGADPNYGEHYGTSTIAFAASEAPDFLQMLVDNGADPNRIVEGQTVLIERMIADENDDTAVKNLIEVGADPKLPNAFGWTPMMVCRVNDMAAMRNVLLEAGLPAEAPHHLVDLFEDRNEPDLENIRHFLKEFDVDVKDENGRTLLTTVAGSGTLEIVSYLLEEGADPNVFIDDASPLSSAASENKHEIVKLLLEHGAKPNNENGHSEALTTAALMSSTESVALLLDAGANPSSYDEYFESALHQAIYEGPKKLILLLLSAGADPNRFNHVQTSPLMYAIDQDRPKIVAAILAAGADVNLRDSYGKTALYHATERGYDYSSKLKKCIKALLEAGADGKLTSFSSTPYSNAAESYKKIAKQILTFETTTQYEIFGKDDPVAFAKQVDAYRLQLWIIKDLDFAEKLIRSGAGKTESEAFSPLITAVKIENMDLLRLLVDEGFSPNGLSLLDESVLQVACRQGSIDAVKTLLDAGADLDHTSPDYGSATLCNAIESGNLELIELLLERGANANLMKVGWTPLIRAATNGNLKMIEILLAAGASKDTKTRANQTAADIAIEKEFEEIANLLQ